MTLIGMPEASALAGMTRAGLRTALMNAGVNIVRINAKALAVSDEDLATFIETRGVSPGRGRPAGSKNKPAANDLPR